MAPQLTEPGQAGGVGAGVDTGAGVGSGVDTGVGPGTGLERPGAAPEERRTDTGVRSDLGPGTGTIFGTDQGVDVPGTQPAPGAPPTDAIRGFGGGGAPAFSIPPAAVDSPGGVDHQSEPGGVDWGQQGAPAEGGFPRQQEDGEQNDFDRADGVGRAAQDFDSLDGVGP